MCVGVLIAMSLVAAKQESTQDDAEIKEKSQRKLSPEFQVLMDASACTQFMGETRRDDFIGIKMVPRRGLEPPRP